MSVYFEKRSIFESALNAVEVNFCIKLLFTFFIILST